LLQGILGTLQGLAAHVRYSFRHLRGHVRYSFRHFTGHVRYSRITFDRVLRIGACVIYNAYPVSHTDAAAEADYPRFASH
jgi:hypothetical protein